MKTISVLKSLSDIDDSKICRVCTHGSDRLWRSDARERHAALTDPAVKAEAICTPQRDTVLLRIEQHASTKPFAKDRFVTVLSGTEANPPEGFRSRTLGLIESCGQEIAAKCTGCRHLVATEARFEYEGLGGKRRFRPMTVAAHCALDDGCGYEPRIPTTQPSCMNCQFRDTVGMLDEYHRTPTKTDLDAYEKFIVRRRANESDNPGAVYQAERHARLQAEGGTYFTFLAYVVDADSEGYDVKFSLETTDVHRISVDSDLVRIFPIGDGRRAAVQIQAPYHRAFGLEVPVRFTKRMLGPSPAPRYTMVPTTAGRTRIDPSCKACTTVACSHHVRDPHRDWDSGEIVYGDPAATATRRIVTDDWKVSVNAEGEFVNARGEEVHLRIFSLLLDDLRKQYGAAADVAFESRFRKVRPRFFTREIGFRTLHDEEIFKSFCARKAAHTYTQFLPDGKRKVFVDTRHADGGLDFREIFGDTFGQPRVDNDRSWAYQDENESLFHAGITPGKPNEREFSIQRLHEELMTTLAMAESMLPNPTLPERSEGEPVVWRTTVLDTFGNPVEDLGPDEVAEFRTADRSAYTEWLDQQVTVDVIEHSFNEERQMATEHASRAHWTNRYAQHGYDLFRGRAKKNRATAKTDAPLGPDDLFQMRPSLTGEWEAKPGYYCTADPDHVFDFDDAAFTGGYGTDCPTCGSPTTVRDFGARMGYAPTKPGTTKDGLPVVMRRDKPYHLEQGRLMEMVCDGWVKRGSNPSNPITLKNLKF